MDDEQCFRTYSVQVKRTLLNSEQMYRALENSSKAFNANDLRWNSEIASVLLAHDAIDVNT